MTAQVELQPITEQIEIAGSVDEVWRVLTEETPKWLGCMRYKKQVGHTFFMQQDQAKAARDDVEGATHCEILALDAPRLFRFSWFVPGFPETEVSFVLEPAGEGATRVQFVHEGWEALPAAAAQPIWDALRSGWRSFVLPNLKRTVEAAAST